MCKLRTRVLSTSRVGRYALSTHSLASRYILLWRTKLCHLCRPQLLICLLILCISQVYRNFVAAAYAEFLAGNDEEYQPLLADSGRKLGKLFAFTTFWCLPFVARQFLCICTFISRRHNMHSGHAVCAVHPSMHDQLPQQMHNVLAIDLLVVNSSKPVLPQFL